MNNTNVTNNSILALATFTPQSTSFLLNFLSTAYENIAARIYCTLSENELKFSCIDHYKTAINTISFVTTSKDNFLKYETPKGVSVCSPTGISVSRPKGLGVSPSPGTNTSARDATETTLDVTDWLLHVQTLHQKNDIFKSEIPDLTNKLLTSTSSDGSECKHSLLYNKFIKNQCFELTLKLSNKQVLITMNCSSATSILVSPCKSKDLTATQSQAKPELSRLKPAPSPTRPTQSWLKPALVPTLTRLINLKVNPIDENHDLFFQAVGMVDQTKLSTFENYASATMTKQQFELMKMYLSRTHESLDVLTFVLDEKRLDQFAIYIHVDLNNGGDMKYGSKMIINCQCPDADDNSGSNVGSQTQAIEFSSDLKNKNYQLKYTIKRTLLHQFFELGLECNNIKFKFFINGPMMISQSMSGVTSVSCLSPCLLIDDGENDF